MPSPFDGDPAADEDQVAHIVVPTPVPSVGPSAATSEGVRAHVQIAMCTTRCDPCEVLPGLGGLAHGVLVRPPDPAAGFDGCRAVVVDAAIGLHRARELCAALHRRHPGPLLVVIDEGALVAVDDRWGVVELLLPAASPAEIEFRLRVASARHRRTTKRTGRWFVGPLTVDSRRGAAWLGERWLPLSGRAFDLLCALAAQPDRVHSREELLTGVWGSRWHDPSGVDIQIRRIRGALGAHAAAIVTVHRVGYRLDVDQLGPPS